MFFLFLMLLSVLPALGQTDCAAAATPMFSTCDLAFDLTPQENPAQASVRAEFRSPRHKTYLIHAFVVEGARLIFRFSPTEAGVWDYQLSGNVARLEGKAGRVIASDSDAAGFVRTANIHHFATT